MCACVPSPGLDPFKLVSQPLGSPELPKPSSPNGGREGAVVGRSRRDPVVCWYAEVAEILFPLVRVRLDPLV